MIHIDLADKDPSLPNVGCGVKCNRQDCPGPKAWDINYGMAGGGCGAYEYCDTCEQVKTKTEDPAE